MNFGAIPIGAVVFLDANVFILHFASNATYSHACEQLLHRVARQEIVGISSAHVLTNVAHRLMTIEAMSCFGWPEAGIAGRLQKHPAEIRQLDLHRKAIDEIAAFGVQIVPITQQLVAAASLISKQHALLSGDALVVAAMQAHNVMNLASHDSDFDAVPGITRYGPA